MPDWQAVSSSNLEAVRYVSATQTLDIRFHTGGTYRYLGVPELVYRRLLEAGSKGSYFHQFIRDQYSTVRIG